MKKLILLLLLSLSFATIITVDDDGDADYNIIQDAINVAGENDTILVSQGTYYENLIIDKTITLASHAIYDNLTGLESWVEQQGLWQVTNDNILNTIINGSSPVDENYGSCILVYNENYEDECIAPTITGFTIEWGTGTRVDRDPDPDNIEYQRLGGGILVAWADPIIEYNKISYNRVDISSGGGIYLSTEPEDFGFENREMNRTREVCDVQEFRLSNNYYNNNEADYGWTLGNRLYENEYNMSESVFDVANCTLDEISPVWVYVEPEATTDFTDIEANQCSTSAGDIYVDPNIMFECVDTGCGEDADNAFKTITWAMQMIMPSEDNHVTIHLDGGTYSPSINEEEFPIFMQDYVSFAGDPEAFGGDSEEEVILDAEQTDRVINMSYSDMNNISNLMIKGGFITSSVYPGGGGIYLENTNSATLTNVIISENTSEYNEGGGIYIGLNSSPILTNVTVADNNASNGGGIYCWNNSNPILTNVTVADNNASYGGGIYLKNNSNPTFENVNIIGNSASVLGGGIYLVDNSNPILTDITISGNISNQNGGGIYISSSYPIFSNEDRCSIYSNSVMGERGVGADIYTSFTEDDLNPIIEVVLDTFTVFNPTDYYASPIENFTFDILNAIETELIDADLYVSPEGDNSNDGLTPETPLKTIEYATSIIFADSLHAHTIRLASGIYSPSTNGEIFPVNGVNYVSFLGEPQSDFNEDGIVDIGDVILDAEDTNSVMKFQNITEALIEGITITGGRYRSSIMPGGGILLYSSSPDLINLNITTNDGSYGGGIYCNNSSPTAENITIINNMSNRGGGICLEDNSNPTFENVYITDNYSFSGGGIYCHASSFIFTNGTINDNTTGSDGKGGGIYLLEDSNGILIDATISNNESGWNGGGIYGDNSSLILTNIMINNNSAQNDDQSDFFNSLSGFGGGIYCRDGSSLALEDVIITDNFSMHSGGGIYLEDTSNPTTLSNVTITNNSTWGDPQGYGAGGGIYSYNSDLIFSNEDRCSIYSNSVMGERGIGADIYASFREDDINPIIEVVLDTFTVINPTDYYASPIDNFTFDILNAIETELIDTDLYVSPEGDNSNDGLTSETPLKTIGYATSIIFADSLHPHTIHLASGTYSPSTNGEIFPVTAVNHVSFLGELHGDVILDAEGTNTVMLCSHITHSKISNLKLTGGDPDTWQTYDYGGGINCDHSNPILENITIIDNEAMYGGGISLKFSNPILNNVTIANNHSSAGGGGIMSYKSNSILTNVTIANNNSGWGSSGISSRRSSLNIVNSIIWNNVIEVDNEWGFDDDEVDSTFIVIDHSNIFEIIVDNGIADIFWLEGNIDDDPLFIDPDNGDFNLQAGSPCIDTGNPSIWYQDLDGTLADMGATGGSFIDLNFIEYDFGEIGDIENTAYFMLDNFRQEPITIESVAFSTSSFTTDTTFPLVINPSERGIVAIYCLPQSFGLIEDSMVLSSPDLPEGISLPLSVVGTDGNILNGNLSGALSSATYRIIGDINIASEDELILSPGTEFLFDGAYNFTLEGILKAQGTQQDSIIFDNYGDEKWRGFTLNNVTNETIFEYVRISGAEKTDGGGMSLSESDPVLNHMTINGNKSNDGGGMILSNSNPTLTHISIFGNEAEYGGGGMRLINSNPTLTYVTISGNTADTGGGMRLMSSDPTLTHVTISTNITHIVGDYGGGMYLFTSEPILINTIIWNNFPESIYISSSVPIITYSDIEGGWEGEENIDIDPEFIDPNNGDFSLGGGSPCIDTGVIIDGLDYYGEAPDRGAFEFDPLLLGDVNGDLEISILDIVIMIEIIIEDYNPSNQEYLASDLNQDSIVDILDIILIVNYILDS